MVVVVGLIVEGSTGKQRLLSCMNSNEAAPFGSMWASVPPRATGTCRVIWSRKEAVQLNEM
eukprot:13837-Eustigmatos_ZCMA.PRE.1